MKKKLLSILLVGTMVFALAACGTKADTSTNEAETVTGEDTDIQATPEAVEEEDEGTADTGESYTIGFSVYDLSNEYFQAMLEGVEAGANENGITLETHDQKGDENELVTGCQNFIDKGVDALVVSPCKPEVMDNIVESAHAKNIPVIILDIGDGGSDKDVIVVSDMYGGGSLAGQYAVELLEANNAEAKEYAVIKCEESATYAIQRGEGFAAVMDKAGYTKVAEITANSDQTEGYNAMQDILASNPDVAAVFAENDNMALGAASAVEEAGKKGEILVFGFDGNDSAVQAIKDGTMAGTVAQQPVEIGKLGIDLAIEKIEGKDLAYDNAAAKEMYAEVYLIDVTGERNDSFQPESR